MEILVGIIVILVIIYVVRRRRKPKETKYVEIDERTGNYRAVKK